MDVYFVLSKRNDNNKTTFNRRFFSSKRWLVVAINTEKDRKGPKRPKRTEKTTDSGRKRIPKRHIIDTESREKDTCTLIGVAGIRRRRKPWTLIVAGLLFATQTNTMVDLLELWTPIRRRLNTERTLIGVARTLFLVNLVGAVYIKFAYHQQQPNSQLE